MNQHTPTYVSNSTPIGACFIVISGGTYVAENFNIDRQATIVQRKNEIGQENGWAMVANGNGVTATATLQLPSIAACPAIGATFTDTFSGTTAEKFVLTGLSQPFAAGDYFKVNASFKVDQF